ncbi:MAG TPA: hypothetical protein VK113_07565 [Gemmatimonadales bacterium]|nr:hypothetical protein [Gemmatimonadales bacterium]
MTSYARRLGLFSGTMAVVGGIIGGGIFRTLAGDRVGARRRYDDFLAQMKSGDGDRAEIAQARAALR